MSDEVRIALSVVALLSLGGTLGWSFAIAGPRALPPALMAFSLGILIRPLLDKIGAKP
jgi:hypothetical protein